MSFKDFFRQFLDQKRAFDAPTQSRAVRIEDTFQKKEVRSINRSDILNYIQSRRDAGAKPATINSELSIIKSFFKHMMLIEAIDKNPADMIPMERGVNQRDRWISVAEESSLINCSPDWLQQVIIFATSTGMRRGEILNLVWSNVDLTLGIIYVRNTKNKKPRTVPITPRVRQVLDGFMSEAIAVGYVFQRKNKSIPVQTLEGAFSLATKKAGIEDLHFHDLRHTYATRLVQHGVDLYSVQRLLGHTNGQMTMRYAHHSTDSLRRAVESCPIVSAAIPAIEPHSPTSQGLLPDVVAPLVA